MQGLSDRAYERRANSIQARLDIKEDRAALVE